MLLFNSVISYFSMYNLYILIIWYLFKKQTLVTIFPKVYDPDQVPALCYITVH